jgi:hypothetical protein
MRELGVVGNGGGRDKTPATAARAGDGRWRRGDELTGVGRVSDRRW